MKSPLSSFIKWLVAVAILPFLSLTTTADAATFNAKNVAELRARINQARNNGAGSVDLIRFTGVGTFNDGGPITINTPVIIQGVNRSKSKIKNQDNKGFIFNIVSNNVTVRNLSLLANKGGGTVGIKLGAVTNTKIQNNTFYKCTTGIISFGVVPVNLTVTGNNFLQNTTSLWTLRDSGRAGSSNPLWGGKYDIRGNFVNGPGGFILDNGNDGTEWVNQKPVHAATNYKGSRLSPMVTNYANGSTVSNNKMVNIVLFGIGLAKCGNVDIKNNNISMKGNTGYGGCIQLEHRTKNCVVSGNTLNAGAGKSGIFLIAFSDHGAKHVYKNGTRNITVTDNIFTGPGTAFTGFGFAGAKAFKNDFRKNKRFRTYSISGGKNSFSQNYGNLGAPGGKIPVGG